MARSPEKQVKEGREMKKLKSLWTLLWSKHYAVLVGSSEEEIGWAIESLRKADNNAKSRR